MSELKCTMCGAPWHEATGHWHSEKRHWCGACTKGMIALIKEFAPRRWGKLRFYDHATVPTGDTSEEDLRGEILDKDKKD